MLVKMCNASVRQFANPTTASLLTPLSFHKHTPYTIRYTYTIPFPLFPQHFHYTTSILIQYYSVHPFYAL